MYGQLRTHVMGHLFMAVGLTQRAIGSMLHNDCSLTYQLHRPHWQRRLAYIAYYNRISAEGMQVELAA